MLSDIFSGQSQGFPNKRITVCILHAYVFMAFLSFIIGLILLLSSFLLFAVFMYLRISCPLSPSVLISYQ